MRALRNVPIKRKLIIITMLTSGVAVLLAYLTLAIYDALALRDAMYNDLETTASIIADNSASALAFNDPDSAALTLKSLATHPHVVGAAIYDAQGQVFATYRNTNFSGEFTPPPPAAPGHTSDRKYLRVFGHIELSGEIIGTVYLQSDLDEIVTRVNRYVVVLVLVLAGSGALTFLLSTKLQRTISTPLLQLAETAKRVATQKNYALRAGKQGDDEVGKLIDGFNEMLNQIQQRDLALQEARDELEKRVQERTQELATSLSLLNSTIESSNDGVLAFSFGGKTSCYNTRFRKMWSLPDDLLQPDSDAVERMRWIAAQTKYPDIFLARQIQNMKNDVTEAFEEIELQDGRIIERYVRPQRVGDTITGVVVTFRDITERRRSEREIETIHRQLLETSRQAGMAEVATGVLHNVGNVLNSVNVSANLIAENIKSSKVSGLTKVAALMREHQDTLAEFISNDARGKHLPGYLLQLADYLPKEQQNVLAELDTLRNNIDHIKQIVAMQQTYSKVSGVKEVVNVIDLVEDSLRMNSGALKRHGIEVIREFDEVPLINTEKHKILQILVNLVRNAKYACSESGKADKRIVMRAVSDDKHIRLEVSDNGIGIAPENLTRIFSHGFTTRKDGHGFGLHSGAIAARELGGSLQAHSKGIGQGATFTLELPIATEAEHA